MGQGLAVSVVRQAGPVQWGFHPSFTRPRCAIMLRPQEIRSSASNTAWRWSRLARPGPGQVWWAVSGLREIAKLSMMLRRIMTSADS